MEELYICIDEAMLTKRGHLMMVLGGLMPKVFLWWKEMLSENFALVRETHKG